MGGSILNYTPAATDEDEKLRQAPLAFPPIEKERQLPATQEGEAEEDASYDDQTEEDEEDGEGEGGGGGGGVTFEEVEHDTDFDPTELQGLSLPILRRSLKKGFKLVSQLTKQSETYLRNFLPDISLRSRVLEVTRSERGHPTLLLDKGQIVQYQFSKGSKLERVRVSPDLEAERAVKYAMAGFIAAGESIDPKDVKFGRSPEFEARMRPVWTREWQKIQEENRRPGIDIPRSTFTSARGGPAPGIT